MSNFTIGKLAKSASVNVETVRFYERKGLIRRPKKEIGGFRYYREEDSTRLRYIRRAQALGYTLREIRELLELAENPKTTCGDYAAQIEGKIAEIEVKIAELQNMKQELQAILSSCDPGACQVSCDPLNLSESCCEPATSECKPKE